MSCFMFRNQEIRRIQSALLRKISILLVGIRRIGKTMLMKEIVRSYTGPGNIVYLDVSDYTSLYDFYGDLMACMPKPLLQRVTNLLQSAGTIPTGVMNWLRRHIETVDAMGNEIGLREPVDESAVTRYWEPIAKAMLKALKDSGTSEELPVLVIDELPFMLKNLLDRKVPTQEITVALATLRKLRGAGIPMLLGGSISLENLLTLHAIPHTVLGGLQRENLRPFSQPEARSYLEALLAGHPTRAGIEVVLERLPDYIPDFLNQSVYFLKGRQDASDVDVTMDNEVLPAIRRSFVEQFQERLNGNYPGGELACAEQLLDMIAMAPTTGGTIDTAGLPEIHRRVLPKLQYDMFVEEAPALGYRFTLNLLRLWWRSQRRLVD